MAITKTAKSPKTIWELPLYIAGLTQHSTLAIRNICEICDEHLQGRYDLELGYFISPFRNQEQTEQSDGDE